MLPVGTISTASFWINIHTLSINKKMYILYKNDTLNYRQTIVARLADSKVQVVNKCYAFEACHEPTKLTKCNLIKKII